MGPWHDQCDVERETSTCVHWCNTSRPHLALGAIAPQQAENQHAITRKKEASTPLHETRDSAGQLNGSITLALHPLRGAAPFTGRYTRSERVQCPRIGCTALADKNHRGTWNPTTRKKATSTPLHETRNLADLPQPAMHKPSRKYKRCGMFDQSDARGVCL